MPKINGLSVTQYDNLNVIGKIYVNGGLLGTPGSSPFSNPNITNLKGDLSIDNLFIQGVQKFPTAQIITSTDDSTISPGTHTTITSVAHGRSNGDTVVITDTISYNGTHIVSNVTTDTFDIPVSFVFHAITAFADSIGSPGVQTLVTSVAHGLSNGVTVKITDTINYNGTYIISNVLTDSFEIVIAFVITETGNWNDDLTGNFLTSESTGTKSTNLANVNILGQLGQDGNTFAL